MASERWLAVVGWEGYYEVSDLGRVRRIAQTRGTRCGILKTVPDRKGYPQVVLSRHSLERTRPVHRLVGEAFIGPLPKGLVTRHLNGNQTDNRAVNLAYGTRRENSEDMLRHGTNYHVNKTHCRNGHEFTPENTKRYPCRPNSRVCRKCERFIKAESKRRRRAILRRAA